MKGEGREDETNKKLQNIQWSSGFCFLFSFVYFVCLRHEKSREPEASTNAPFAKQM